MPEPNLPEAALAITAAVGFFEILAKRYRKGSIQSIKKSIGAMDAILPSAGI
jgi:hypothetical protein